MEKTDFNETHNEYDKDRRHGKTKKGLIIALVFFLSFLLIGGYVSGVVYFSDRFFLNTRVNGEDVSRQQLAEVRDVLEDDVEDFFLTIIGDEGQTEQIYATEINLRFAATQAIEDLLSAQNSFAWPFSLIDSQEAYVQIDTIFDEDLLNERILNLDVVTFEQTEPVNANVILEGNEAVIIPHQVGSVVDVELLQEGVYDAISVLSDEFDVEETIVEIQPELTTQTPDIINAYETLNSYLTTEITYLVGDEVVLDHNIIADWITIDENLIVHLDQEQIGAWLDDFISSVNTHNTTRSLTTPQGRDVTVTGGYFGWIVSRDLEFAELLSNIQNGDVVSREPIYFQRAISHSEHDWGNTFLQVDLSEQHMWAIVDGEVVFESPVVTGLPNGERNTPQGVYSILEMSSPSVLISPWTDPRTGEPTYEIPVSYWMRYTWSGYGFHDGEWQPSFGGTQYRSTGSHGCTNLPLAAARELFGLIFINIPVVVHY